MPLPVHEHCRKMATKDGQQAPWWETFPDPVAKADTVEPSEVFALLEKQKTADKPKDFLLVDVRRNDYEGGTVATSINLPAQSLYPTRKVVYDLAKQAGVKKVIFYCGEFLHTCPIRAIFYFCSTETHTHRKRPVTRPWSSLRRVDAGLHQ